VSSLSTLGRFGLFCVAVGSRALRHGVRMDECLRHAATLTARCALPVLLTMFPFGAVIAVQGMGIFDLFGAHRLLSGLLSLIVIRELGPVLSAVLVAAQGGSSFAAELGTMRTKEEIDATAVMGVDALRWHVLPRVLAMTIVVPGLTITSSAMGILGGWCVAVVLFDQDSGVFVAHLAQLIGPWDLVASVIKGLCYGLLVGLIATFRGWETEGGAEGVGRAVNDTVVAAVVYLLVLNYALSSLMFGGAP
jgi:phospholipid/cholesterol/gamma-HCH transport system permease protein